MTKEKSPEPKRDDKLEDRPAKPGNRRASEWGVGREHTTPSPDPDHSPTSKTPV